MLILIAMACGKAPVEAPGALTKVYNALDYVPGQDVTWEEYEKLGEIFSDSWKKGNESEFHLTNLISRIEPEATRAMLRILEDPNTRTMYISYTPEPFMALEGDSFNSSFDGLLGFRVLKQLEVPHPSGGHRLLSSIITYHYDPAYKRLVPRLGPDAIRIRIEIEPWRIIEGDGPRGMMGFSWATFGRQGGAKIEAARGTSYVNPNGTFKYKDVTACGFADHCNLCHHAESRNHFAKLYAAKRPPEKNPAFAPFLRLLKNEMHLSDGELDAVTDDLKHPERAFAAEDLKAALRARLAEITR